MARDWERKPGEEADKNLVRKVKHDGNCDLISGRLKQTTKNETRIESRKP